MTPGLVCLHHLNHTHIYIYYTSVGRINEEKIVLIDEEMIEYNVIKGDYLGKIAKKFGVRNIEFYYYYNVYY